MPDNTPKIQAILCEGFRLEANNKLLIFGVYGGDVIVASFPAHLQLALYFEVSNIGIGHHKFEFEIKAPGNVTFTVGLEADQIEEGHAAIPTPGFGMKVEQAGELVVNCRIDDGEWQQALTRKIAVGKIN